jgi:hypothetical protein
LGEDQLLLQSAADGLPDEAYAEVHQRVLAGTVHGRTRLWRLLTIAAAAVAACWVVAVQVGSHEPVHYETKPIVTAALPPVTETNPIRAEQPRRTPIKRSRKARTVPPSNGAELIAAFDALYEDRSAAGHGDPGQTVITMQTQDPSVTILLLTENNGDAE